MRRFMPLLVGLLLVGLQSAGAAALPQVAGAQGAPQSRIPRNTPLAVATGKAGLRSHHDPGDMLQLNVGLQVHNSAALDTLIKEASTPGSPQYGHYLTGAEYDAQYAPSDAELRAARAWLRSQGLNVTGASPDNLLIHVRASAADAERAFGVTINDYTENGRTFHANDRDPSVPANLRVNWISGLSDYDVFKPLSTCTGGATPRCGYDGGDFRTAYDIPGDGKGQTLGFTLWGRELQQADFTGYANATGTTAITVGGTTGDDVLNWVQVDGATTESDTDTEVALDTQIAHGVAPGIHLTYWLGHDSSNSTLEDVLNDAANSSLSVISNSWGAQSVGCPVDANMETSLQKGAAKGQTYYFSTGDSPASAGCQYPAVSQYVVAVGGTNLNVGAGSVWSSETADNSDGGGCTNSETRPSWQTGIGSPLVAPGGAACTGRAEPDVSADSGIGVFLYVDGAATCCTGGTSLATPIWAGLSIIWNKNNANSGRPGIGFAGPVIYSVANDATAYARDFHDITSGTNGFAAGTGWDEVTGWGSPDFNKLSNNPISIAYTGPTQASKGDTITLSATLDDQGTTNGLANRKISFAAAGESCTGTTDATGKAQCPVTITDAPGHYQAIAVFAGDAAWVAGSDTQNFTVLHIPTTVTYTGVTSGDYNDPATLSARLTDNSNSAPIPGEKINLSFGAEGCSGVTNGSGVATCSVTPLDLPSGSPYTITASFAGDEPTYEPSTDTSHSFTVNKEDSQLTYSGATTSDFNDTVSVSAHLVDPSNAAEGEATPSPIAGKAVTFSLNSTESCTGATDATGIASCSLTAKEAAGTYTLNARFASDAFYQAADVNVPFAVTLEDTKLTSQSSLQVFIVGATATLSSTLVDPANPAEAEPSDLPIANPVSSDAGPVPTNVTMTLGSGAGSQACTAATNASGVATCSFTVSSSVGNGFLTITDSFSDPTNHFKSATNTQTALVAAFPAHGSFEIGDVTEDSASPAGASVNWWGPSHWKTNSFSSLPAGEASEPHQMKGFIETTASVPPTCGTTWTSDPGDSSNPPTTVPAYMATIVASNVGVNPNGSVITGNTVEIVVIQTNLPSDRYASGAGNEGTGPIVAEACPSNGLPK